MTLAVGVHAPGVDDLSGSWGTGALAALAQRIGVEKQWPVHIAAHLERVEIPT